MDALKFNYSKYDRWSDNIETVKGLDKVLKNWLLKIELPFDASITKVEALDFKPYDGFIPHAHNRGGFDLFTMTDVASLYGSGEHYGLTINDRINNQWSETEKEVLADNKTLNDDDLYSEVQNRLSGDYDGIAWQVRAMYEGNGVLMIYAGFNYDAPYYRNFETSFKRKIKFKTLNELKTKLNNLTNKIELSYKKKKRKPKQLTKAA